MKKTRYNFTLKVYEKGQQVKRLETSSKRRFLNHIRTINWQDRGIKVYLRVSYGKQKDVWGKLTNFYNDGFYEDRNEFWKAFEAFTEN